MIVGLPERLLHDVDVFTVVVAGADGPLEVRAELSPEESLVHQVQGQSCQIPAYGEQGSRDPPRQVCPLEAGVGTARQPEQCPGRQFYWTLVLLGSAGPP